MYNAYTTYTHTHAHVYTYTHIHIHTYTHAHTHKTHSKPLKESNKTHSETRGRQ